MLRSRPLSSLFLCLALAVAGCAGGTRTSDGSQPRRSANRITSEEVRAATEINALDLVRDLRPGWRGMVYQDDYQLGGMEELRGIPTSRIDWIEYVEAVAAASRFGNRNGTQPAIVVHTR